MAKNSIYVEFLGTGPMLSINYDRILLNKPKWNLIGRIGTIGWYENIVGTRWEKTRTLVLGLTLLLNEKIVRDKRKNFTELGIGHSSVWRPEGNLYDYRHRLMKPNYNMFHTLIIGYRTQPINRGVIFRGTGALLILSKPVDFFWDTYRFSIFLWVGISIGYSF